MTYNCVQIGLCNSAEYLYLTGKIDQNLDELKQLPTQFPKPSKDWQFYGVDCDPTSIHTMLDKYSTEIPNAQFICAGIRAEAGLGKFNSWFHTGYGYTAAPGDGALFGAACLTLEQLFAELGLQAVDVLAMDIEGTEYKVFRNYTWNIKPKFIAVECHGGPDEILEIIQNQGYRLYREAITNEHPKGSGKGTTELQFIYEENDNA